MTIIITGAASGIGQAVARHLSSLNKYLLLMDKNGPVLHQLQQELQYARDGSRHTSNTVAAISGNVSSKEDVSLLFNQLWRKPNFPAATVLF